MAGLEHSVSGSDGGGGGEGVETAARNSRIGLIFFAIYLAIYSGYVGLAAFAPSVMDRIVLAGLNLAIVYGLALIVCALIFAVAYGWACRAPLDRAAAGGDGTRGPGRESGRGT